MSDAPRPSLRDRVAAAPVVWAVAAIDVALLVLVYATGGITNANMYRWGAQLTPVPVGDWWRLFTSIFLHFGVIHIAFNLWALAAFGPMLERMVGHLRFAALLLAAGLAGSAASALFVPDRALSAGTSGAIFGLLGAFGVVGFRLRDTPGGRGALKQAGILLGLNIFIGLSNPQIGLAAHLGGLVGGSIVMLAQSVGTATREQMITADGALVEALVPPSARRWSGLTAAAVVSVASLVAPFTLR